MRVNVDDVAFMDPRFKKLGARLGMTWFEALGRCLPVWTLAYVGRSPILAPDDVDAVAERSGFAEAMIHTGLGAAHVNGIWVRGVADRIDFLLLQDAKRERANEARRYAMGITVTHPRGLPAGDAAGLPGGLPYSPALAPDLTLAPALALTPVASAPAGKSKRKRKSDTFECTPDERAMAMRVLGKLGERNGVAYEGCDDHLRLIVGRHREGRSERDLRAVVAFCAEVKKWEGDPDWEHCLCPETLFGPKNITRYLDPARSWAAKAYPEEPKLEVVK